jgi:CRP/FNR family transcriptional regulator, cyclic AMP receptor protein
MSNDIFDQLPLFEGINDAQLALLRQIFTPVDCYANTMLFEQGDPAEFLYLVVVGEVIVNFKPDDGPAITVARVQPGGAVGWSAALGSRSYTSRAECLVYTQMLRVRGTDLRKLCEQNPEAGLIILDRLATVIAERLSSTHKQVVALLELGLRAGTQCSGG